MIGLPPARARGAADEVDLPAEAGVDRRGPIESAHTWPVRSTSIAELIATILSFCAITNGSLT